MIMMRKRLRRNTRTPLGFPIMSSSPLRRFYCLQSENYLNARRYKRISRFGKPNGNNDNLIKNENWMLPLTLNGTPQQMKY